jgi:putative ABC transport system permease protein
MALPFTYNLRSVFVRWRSTLATVLGMALVVWVFVLMQALAAGLESSSRNTGDPRNILIVRKGSTAESSSIVTREQYRTLTYLPQIARDAAGRPLVSADLMVLISLPRRDGSGEANVLLRGVSPMGPELRPQVRLVAGRWFQPGKREVVVSRKLAARFANFEIGGAFKSSGSQLTVVGWMDGANSAFDSEVWMDADEARKLYDREDYSSVLARTTDTAGGLALSNRLESDKRLPLNAVPEVAYYSAQTRTARPIRFIGYFLAVAMSVGAIFSAMNTMYASVGARTREVGTLRVLGYRRRAILAGFLVEGVIQSLVGGLIGCAMAVPIYRLSAGTLSFDTFSETVFQFRVTPGLAMRGLVFAVVMGLAGSLLPALRAARLPVIGALKSV